MDRRHPARILVAGNDHHGDAGRKGLCVKCSLCNRERFWRYLCRRNDHGRCIRRQLCPTNSDESPPTHPSNVHSQPTASAMSANRQNRNSCAGITWIKPSRTSRSLPQPMKVVALAPCITLGLPRPTMAAVGALPHAFAMRSKMLLWSVLNSPNPSSVLDFGKKQINSGARVFFGVLSTLAARLDLAPTPLLESHVSPGLSDRPRGRWWMTGCQCTEEMADLEDFEVGFGGGDRQ